MDYFWSDKCVEELKRLRSEELTAAQIARRLIGFGGNKIGPSRSAVIGKLNRLGLSRAVNAVRQDARALRRIASKAFRRPPVRIERPVKIERAKLPSVVALIEPEPLGAARDIPARGCRWIYGEPIASGSVKSWRYCASEKVDGKSYCAFHAMKSVAVPVSPRLRVVT